MSQKLLKYDSDIVWSVPCLFRYEMVAGALYQTVNRTVADTELKLSTYGAPASAWSGDTFPAIYDKLDLNTLDLLNEYFDEINVKITYLFSNTYITQESLKDEYANFLLKHALEHKNDFIVYSDILKDYIKEKDENAVIISSVTKAIEKFQGKNSYKEEADFYNNLLKDYTRVTLRPEFVKKALLNDLSLIEDLSKTEIAINYACLADCPQCLTHINVLNKAGAEPERLDLIDCPLPFVIMKEQYEKNCSLSSEEINLLFNKGVRYFKYDMGKHFDINPEMIALLIAGQIFNLDGNNYLAGDKILTAQLQMEYEYFREKLATSIYYGRLFQ